MKLMVLCVRQKLKKPSKYTTTSVSSDENEGFFFKLGVLIIKFMMKYFGWQNDITKYRNDWVNEFEHFFTEKYTYHYFLVRIYSNVFQIGSQIAN